MKFGKGTISIKRLQWLVWLLVCLIQFFSVLPIYVFKISVIYTVITIAFYLLIIYGNINFLYPRLYEKGLKLQYVLCIILFVPALSTLRGYLFMLAWNRFGDMPEEIMPGKLLNFLFAGALIYLLSFIYRIALAYFTLKQQAEEILVQKSQAELNLLKSQVQPHFLFNTLNNIYYEAYIEAPKTAGLIERLSEIMRYFVDESTKDEVSVNKEIQFIENYIALETIRIKHGVELNFKKKLVNDFTVPPMLLMTFVENIFKHGIDKSNKENKIEISLEQCNGYLSFKTVNTYYPADKRTSTGFGIENLKKRMTLLYGAKYELYTEIMGPLFVASLKIPMI